MSRQGLGHDGFLDEGCRGPEGPRFLDGGGVAGGIQNLGLRALRVIRQRSWRSILFAGLLSAGGLYYVAAIRTPPGPRSLRVFDPDRMADLELRMWRAYYAKENVRLFALLVTMLHEQNRYPWAKATRAGFHLARAAATFGDARGDYERVLPDLERAYAIARDWNRAGFDPKEVARAELAWWAARRKPGASTVENVGALIAEEYALLYEVPRERVAAAAARRAEAAALRDSGRANADWPTVSRILQDSYRQLRTAVAKPPNAALPTP